MMLYVILAAAALTICCVSVPQETTTTTSAPASYVNLKAAEFKKLVDDEKTFVLDVRTPEEKHIKGTDAVIPYDKIKENQDKLPADKNTTIAVYCTSGRRGEIAARDLAALGYVHVINLEGGATAWQKAGYEME
jgi:rhodanese-related sulfurtransferase